MVHHLFAREYSYLIPYNGARAPQPCSILHFKLLSTCLRALTSKMIEIFCITRKVFDVVNENKMIKKFWGIFSNLFLQIYFSIFWKRHWGTYHCGERGSFCMMRVVSPLCQKILKKLFANLYIFFDTLFGSRFSIWTN